MKELLRKIDNHEDLSSQDYWDYPEEIEFLDMKTEIIKIEKPIIKRKEDVKC